MTIRTANKSDHAAWLQMRAALLPNAEVSVHAADIDEYFLGKGLIAVALMSDEGGIVRGFMEVSLRSWAEGCRCSPVPYIEASYVMPAARRRGICRALAERAEDWARSKGFKEIACDTWLEAPSSQALISSLGFAEVSRVVHYWKEIAD